MKVVVRFEDDQACVWAVGDDGETIDTAYINDGEQVDVNVSVESIANSVDSPVTRVEFGEVGPIAVPEEDEEATAAAKAEETPPATGDSGDRGTQKGGGSTT